MKKEKGRREYRLFKRDTKTFTIFIRNGTAHQPLLFNDAPELGTSFVTEDPIEKDRIVEDLIAHWLDREKSGKTSIVIAESNKEFPSTIDLN